MGAINYPFGTYPRAIIRSDLTAHAKALYVTLADYTTTNRMQCYPSKARLCSQLKWSDHTLEKYTRELITAGWISRQPRRDQGGRFSGWLYHVYTSPSITSDQAGGSSEPIASKGESAGRQNFQPEVKQEVFEEESKEEKHTPPGEGIPSVSESADCVCSFPSCEKRPVETFVESFQRFVLLPPNVKTGIDSNRVFSGEELETIELTIERYRTLGTLQNLPGLIRYFNVHGVDTSCLPGLRQWKQDQENKAQMDAEVREQEVQRLFETHILTCKSCKPDELCAAGEELRPKGLEDLGCWGCEHFERDEGLAAMNMGRCRVQNATVRNPTTHQCATKRSDSLREG